MGNKPASSASDNVINKKCKTPELLDSGKPRVTALAFKPLPAYLLDIVGGYLSIDNDDPVKYALLDSQPITLCLSQDIKLQLDSSWQLGFLPTERQWQKATKVKMDKQFLINDLEGCLQFLAPEKSNYCRVLVEVLVVKLNLTEEGASVALGDLRHTVEALRGHLSNMKRVVISIAEHTSCCFSFRSPIDKSTGLFEFFDPQQALCQIVDDLDTCRKNNRTLTTHDLLAFYFNNKEQPVSEKYLAKLVISLNHPANRDLFQNEAPNTISDKIMCVDRVVSLSDFEKIGKNRTRLYHAIHLDATALRKHGSEERLSNRLDSAFSYCDNRFIERIVAISPHYPFHVTLPRLSEPLTNITPFSALVELSLESENTALHLADLNTGYFRNLKHLSFIGATLTGHLDSHRVPLLKTLIIDLDRHLDIINRGTHALIHEHTQSLIDTGLSWQLLASKFPRGWSLATYDDPVSNPQDEEKDASLLSSPPLPSLPIIRELMLFATSGLSANEWEMRLRGNPSMEAAAGIQREGLLVWAPERVEKITMFGNQDEYCKITLHSVSPGQTRILSSLTSYNISVYLLCDALPHLQSLRVIRGKFATNGVFHSLETLSFRCSEVSHPCQLEAPMLQSLSCYNVINANNLRVRMSSLSQLSFLRLEPHRKDPVQSPKFFLVDDEISRVSHAMDVVLGSGMTLSPLFNKLQEFTMSHLKLDVEPQMLPAGWSTTAWQCESLELRAHTFLFNVPEPLAKPDEMVLPQLPLVKTLKVEENQCNVLLDREMPELTDLTVPSPRSLGPNLRCPALRCIRFTGNLSDIVKKQWLDPATYSAFGAQPRWVYFEQDGEAHKMA